MSKEKPSPFVIFHLSEDDQGQSLGIVLKRRLPEWSWGQTREAILKRRVQINGNLCLDQARKMTAKDVIKLWRESLPKPVDAKAVRFAYVDEFLVVVEKPPGVTSTRHFEERNLADRRKQLQPTLEELIPEALEEYLHSKHKTLDTPDKRVASKRDTKKLVGIDAKRQRSIRQKKYGVVAVHRLDRDTSGLMIFARTESIAQALGSAFRKHEVTRLYHAVVHGHPKQQTFDSVLVRDRGDGKRGSATDQNTKDPTAQRAITHIRPIETLGEYSVIECRLETGRTHQIRIHLSEAGHPLCGETIYQNSMTRVQKNDHSGAPRQALHSATLEFKHPISGELLKFRMPWPADLHQWLKTLKRI